MHDLKWTERSQFPSRLVHKWNTTKYDVQVAFVIMKKICLLHLNKIVELFAKIFVENSGPFCYLPNQRKWVWSHRISWWPRTCYCKSNSLRDSDGSVSVCRVAWQKLANISPERCRCSWRRNICPAPVDYFCVRSPVHLVAGLVWTEFGKLCRKMSAENPFTDLPLMWHFKCCGWSTNSHSAMHESSVPHKDPFHPAPIGLNDRLTCISDDK